MPPPATATPEKPSFRFSPKQSIGLVFLCTLFGAAAQMLIKTGANALAGTDPLSMLFNMHLLAGYSLYGISTMLLILALRDGELSILWPVIALTYVWVTILSTFLLKEVLTANKIAGISVIVAGVAVLGLGDRR